MNDGLAGRLGLVDVGPLRATPAQPLAKIVVFSHESDQDAVREAAFAAGAGKLGAYERCTFATRGRGSFLGIEGANPTIGVVGTVEEVEEWRIEMICPADRVAETVAAIRRAHSYEEPAIDVFALAMPGGLPGIGRVGRLREATKLGEFAGRVQAALKAPGLQYVGDPAQPWPGSPLHAGRGRTSSATRRRPGRTCSSRGRRGFTGRWRPRRWGSAWSSRGITRRRGRGWKTWPGGSARRSGRRCTCGRARQKGTR